MDLTIRLGTRPQPGTWPRVVILIVIITAVLAVASLGYRLPSVITLITGAALAAARAARALLPSREPGEAP